MSDTEIADFGLGPQIHREHTSTSRASRGIHRHDGGLSHFADLVQSISNQDAEARYKAEEADNRLPTDDSPDPSQFQGAEGKTIISWEPNDKENPYNWPRWRKNLILVTTMTTVLNSTMGSSLPSMAIPYMMKEWGITSQTQSILPISTFLMGYVFGPIVFVTGQLADIYNDSVARGRAMSWFMVFTIFGPLLAPIISGFSSTSIGWRWTFWIGLIFAGATSILVAFLPETYAPVLLTRRARKIRKADPKAQVYSAFELEPHDMKQLVTRVLTRPIRMILTELIVTATCLYLSLVYAIFYMSFQAFPIIFQDVYGLSPGVTGLCYLPIGFGAMLALPVFFTYDHILLNAQARGEAWSKKEEFRRVPLATLGGPLFVISLFWLGWSARSNVSFVVPMLAGIPFGAGFNAYEIFAASANAAASSCRSVFAVALPFATIPMFDRLGISGACSLLGGLSLCMCAIPFIFIWKGAAIRERSKFCIALKEQKREMERRHEEQQRRRARAAASGGMFGDKETI
ncbi:hypothetical protein ABKA04_003314 [Annulohypoxylon sp. FPYF3050]